MIGDSFLLLASLFVVFGAFEYLFPAEQGQPFASRLKNFGYAALLFLSSITLVIWMNRYLYPQSLFTVPSKWYFSVLAIFVVVFLNDLIFYLYHRAQHAFAPLWRIHRLHHTDEALNVSTSMRTNLIEAPLQNLIITLPIAYFLGLDAGSASVVSLITTIWLFFGHANLKIHLGPFARIFVGPQVHRIHHSKLIAHRDKNFSQYFSFIDVAFGTYYHPAEKEYPATGLNHLE